MVIFRSIREMDLKEFTDVFLPKNHTEQDKKYIKARYAWETFKGDVHLKSELYARSSEAYEGTTFQKRNYIQNRQKDDRQRQTQQSLFPDQGF